jgi:hypothetical protein
MKANAAEVLDKLAENRQPLIITLIADGRRDLPALLMKRLVHP